MAMHTVTMDITKFDITPDYKVSLLGYFNERISQDVLDPLFCRIAALKLGDSQLLFIQIDSCLIMKDDADLIKRGIESVSEYKYDEIMIFTTHTHTAPALTDFFESKRESVYIHWLSRAIVKAVLNLKPSPIGTVKITRTVHEGLSYNRRWFLKDGSVVTNPPKLSPLRIKPEGMVDHEIQTIGFCSEDKSLKALFVNLSNHTDTIGGNKISADWPGFLEKYLNRHLHKSFPVFTLIAPQGNINHFNFDSSRNQTNYSEADRIGKTYAQIVADSLDNAVTVKIPDLESRFQEIKVLPREVKTFEIAKANARLKTPVKNAKEEDLTAEDLAKENPAVEHLFAKEVIAFSTEKPEYYIVPLQVLKLGKIAFCAVPGEPFVEIGLELKKLQGYEMIIPVALANGYFGYIPLQECFARGGYEVKASRYNCLSRNAAKIIIEKFKDMLAYSTE